MVVVVEYDEEIMWVVDEIIDFGLGVGVCGGKIVVKGILEKVS